MSLDNYIVEMLSSGETLDEAGVPQEVWVRVGIKKQEADKAVLATISLGSSDLEEYNSELLPEEKRRKFKAKFDEVLELRAPEIDEEFASRKQQVQRSRVIPVSEARTKYGDVSRSGSSNEEDPLLPSLRLAR